MAHKEMIINHLSFNVLMWKRKIQIFSFDVVMWKRKIQIFSFDVVLWKRKIQIFSFDVVMWKRKIQIFFLKSLCGRERYKYLEVFTNLLLLTQGLSAYKRQKEKMSLLYTLRRYGDKRVGAVHS